MPSEKGKHFLLERAELPDIDLGDNYYVYGLYDQDTLFYIGKGKGRRYKGHFPACSLKKASYKNKKIKKINSEGRKVIVKILARNLTERESLILESRLINNFGTHNQGGLLTNVYYGNLLRTSNGYKFPDERKQYMSQALRGKNSPVTEELVLKAKLLVHYRGFSYEQIAQLPEYSNVSAIAIKNWCNRTNYSYIRPDLKTPFELRDEQMEECFALWKKGFQQKQVAEILGLDLWITKRLIQRKQKLLKGLPVRRAPVQNQAA